MYNIPIINYIKAYRIGGLDCNVGTLPIWTSMAPSFLFCSFIAIWLYSKTWYSSHFLPSKLLPFYEKIEVDINWIQISHQNLDTLSKFKKYLYLIDISTICLLLPPLYIMRAHLMYFLYFTIISFLYSLILIFSSLSRFFFQ